MLKETSYTLLEYGNFIPSRSRTKIRRLVVVCSPPSYNAANHWSGGTTASGTTVGFSYDAGVWISSCGWFSP
jgi:hypothetical protein